MPCSAVYMMHQHGLLYEGLGVGLDVRNQAERQQVRCSACAEVASVARVRRTGKKPTYFLQRAPANCARA